jgi:hypothetical protein
MSTYTHVSATTLYLGACETCNRPYRIDMGGETERSTLTQWMVMPCPGGCRMTVKFERLAAVFTEEVCDARCMGATGPSCSCACGGTNHGASWGATATTYELESAVKALRARQEREEKARQARKDTKQARKERIFTAWVEDGNQDVVDYLATVMDGGSFILDMVDRVRDLEPLSERQAEVVRDIAAREADHAARRAVYEASKTTAPLGKGLTVEGTVISVKPQDGYAYGTTDWKMTVECAGYRVWGSVPRSLIGNIITAGCYDRLKGQRVRFVAELVPSKGDDPSFVYFKRPTKAEKLDPVGV